MSSDETTVTSFAGRDPPRRIGPYKILETVGEGGMGVVYLAEQEKPVRRRVALKLIKAGMDTKQVIARFESERQALALMDHPSIAKVFDAGTTPDGRPYFAMEYVKGEPVTRYCDRHRLDTRERLELFIQVCGGVQHAHQKGIIHRDIKSSNVLVAIRDEKPVPKIIDFGVAKATEQRLTEQTVYTQLGVLIGTPEYMSPEQAEMTGLDVDTRTDVYSLGVLLYELLTGVLPFDPTELRRSGFDEIRRKIREEEPSRPSTRVSTLEGEKATGLSTTHRAELPALRRQLSGDLDWITMKALEKDRTRRYQSAADLAADIERHLTSQPVLASPPSAAYRMGKFVRRHKVGVAAGVVVAVAVVLGIAGTSIGMVRAQRAEAQALREAETAGQVSDFLVGLFRGSHPFEARGSTITAREILDKGAEKIEQELKDRPLVQARLTGTIGRVYHGLGLFGDALPLLEQSLAARRKHLGENHPEVAESLVRLGAYHLDIGALDTAQPLFEEALRIQETTLGPEDPEVALTLRYLGSLLREKGVRFGDFGAARAHLERAVAIWEASLGPDHPDFATGLHHLALVHYNSGNLQEARSLLERALAIREKAFGPEHPAVADTLTRLGGVSAASGDFHDAKRLWERALGVSEKVFGPDHPYIAFPLINLGDLLAGADRHDEARPLFERAAEIQNATGTTDALRRIADLHAHAGDFESAESVLERVVAVEEATHGSDDFRVSTALWELARFHLAQGSRLDADELFERALAIYGKLDDASLAPLAYAEACRSALLGDRDAAIRSLKRAIAEGFSNHDHLATDSDLKSLHGDPEFEAIAAALQTREEADEQ